MKTYILLVLGILFCMPSFAQPRDPNWDTRVRKTSYFGVALSQAPVYETAIADAKTTATISRNDSIQFIHEMNGFWYVNTDKGAEGYVKGLRYQDLNLDSLRLAPVLYKRALLAAKERAVRDSTEAAQLAERMAALYAQFDTVAAQRIANKEIWEGMTKEMALLSVGEPKEKCMLESALDTTEAWEYDAISLYFKEETVELIASRPVPVSELPKQELTALPVPVMPKETEINGIAIH